MMAAHEPAPETETRLTRARSEFVATLGRRLTALYNTLHQLEDDPASHERRDMLQRRVHALGSAAKVLGFDGVAEALGEAERALGRSAVGAPVSAKDLAEVSRALDLLPSIAWGAKVPSRVAEPEGEVRLVALGWPLSILVFGPAALQSALAAVDDHLVECELAEDADAFRDLAKKIGPDVAVVDGDQRHARELLENLAHDPLIEPFPVIVVGTFESPESASSFVASGAARVLPKPVGPDTLRRAVLDVSQHETGLRGPREPVGDVTVDDLAARVAAEIRRGLVEGAEPGCRGVTVPLGDGVDVLAAVWGAVARMRELVTMRSGGAVRFGSSGPEGAVPLAPWTSEERRAGERGASARRSDGVRLEGRRAVVVDDDPAVVWFLSGLLKTSGVEVAEAHEGSSARELVFEGMPDVVVSDVLMPGLDGFSLCRAIKRDVAVRDVPVILLSWKEDLLQRVRELGVGADGYLRKEAAASTVLQRVREVLRPRARVEARLAGGGEVRGRLDGLTTRLLLQLARQHQPSSRVVVRDAVYLYELEMREGAPRRITRTASDGAFDRGSRVLDALLGVSAGRFVIAPSTAQCRDEIRATLDDALGPRIRRARALVQILEGRFIDRIDALVIDPETIGAYVDATPSPARALLEKLLDGVPPREIAEADDAARAVLELVLADIARRGAIREVWRDGVKMDLEGAPPAASDLAPGAESPPPLFTLELSAAPPDVAEAMARWEQPDVVAREGSPPLPLSRTVTPVPTGPPSSTDGYREPHTAPGVGPAPIQRIATEEVAPGPDSQPPPEERSSLDRVDEAWGPSSPDAAMPDSQPARGASPEPGPANVEAPRAPQESQAAGAVSLGAPDPQAVGDASHSAAAAPLARQEPTVTAGGFEPVKQSVELPVGAFPSERDAPSTLRAESENDTKEPGGEVPVELIKPVTEPKPARELAHTLPSARPIEFPRAPRKNKEDRVPSVRVKGPSPSPKPRPAPPPREEDKPIGAVRIALLSIAAAAVAFGAVTLVRNLTAGPPAASVAPTGTTTASSAAPVPAAKPSVQPTVQDLDMPPGVPVAGDKGLLEVDLGAAKHPVYVDGAFVGRGPSRRVPLPPGQHQFLLKLPEGDVHGQVEIKTGRRLRVSLPPTP